MVTHPVKLYLEICLTYKCSRILLCHTQHWDLHILKQITFTNEDTGSDVDPDWLYADLDPKNLINADPIPGQ